MQQAIIDLEPLMTFKEAMGYLRVSRSTLLRMMGRKEIPSHKVGSTWRFYRDELRGAVRKVTAEQGE